MRSAEHHLSEELGREPTAEELHGDLSRAMRERVSVDDVAAARNGLHCGSLDYTAQTKDGVTDPLASLIADPASPDPADSVIEALDLRQQVADHTAGLAPKEHALVRSRFGLDGREPATICATASQLGIDVPAARRLERAVIDKMRSAAGVDATTPEPTCRPAAALLDMLRNRPCAVAADVPAEAREAVAALR